MLTGDHVLPRITPNIGLHPQSGDDPLGSFLTSLDKLAPYDCDEVLPAHEHRFVGLQARLAELTEHHEHRFDEVLGAIRAGHDTAWEVAGHMKWSRSWDRIEGFMRRMAVSEAMAHIRALERRGVLRAIPGEAVHYEVVGSG
jgi:glyoxylase-like metal-dependent hydrolase (beta-lactamase superfamily II)